MKATIETEKGERFEAYSLPSPARLTLYTMDGKTHEAMAYLRCPRCGEAVIAEINYVHRCGTVVIVDRRDT